MPTIVYEQTWDVEVGGDDGANNARVTSPVYEGAGSLQINPTAATGFWLKNASGSPTVIVQRIYVRFATLPVVDLPYFLTPNMGAGGFPAVAWDTSSSQFACAWNGGLGTPGGAVITTGVWYRIDAKFDVSTTTVAIDAQVDGTPLTQHTDSSSVGAGVDYRVGDFATSSTWDGYFDVFSVSHTAADYPLFGPGPEVAWLTA